MKTPVKRLFSLGVIAVLSVIAPLARAQAQEAQTKNDGESRLQQLSQQLNLTEDQKTKLKPILQEEAQKLQGIRSDTSSTREQKLQQVKQIQAEYKPQIDAILTPEQQQKWQQMKEQAKSKAREHEKSQSPE